MSIQTEHDHRDDLGRLARSPTVRAHPVGVLTDVTALVLMLAGGLTALQNTVSVTSLPFLVIIARLAVSFWKELRADLRAAGSHPAADVRAEKLTTDS